ncbi:ribonuclease HI large subunit [Aspergillus ellipticus CBS 707.79]|uniref:Ribonuclease n=1 Tax=Aspergillus ellipticus CBS 707.79 TaxID=1448320 RepID=A0A319D4D7_9EURO|nr:ribonuclease HI large subunit [Aspergillus ellipticus CBS 707.79]
MEDSTAQDFSKFPEEVSTTATGPFIPPSIDVTKLLAGQSYAHYSPCPPATTTPPINQSTMESSPNPLVLGVDEAGRGPVLGPMVYSAFYLPHNLHRTLLARDYRFDDSKVLTPGVRANLMRSLCSPGNSLFESCGWAVKLLSARDISSGMMRSGVGAYNLNAQAMDATIELIRGIIDDRCMDVREVYIDTIGNPTTYQQKLEKIFPSLRITVAKKADSLYPCVSAASVAAKVTRDIALELCHQVLYNNSQAENPSPTTIPHSWGSGYPSDSKCVNWLRNNMDPIFGWGNECRFSWGTAKELLELKGGSRVDWPGEEENMQLSDFLLTSTSVAAKTNHELQEWYGSRRAEVLS